MRRTVFMSEMSWIQYRERVATEGAVVLLPVGALEQHGPHLPLGTDAILATEMARRAAERLDGVVAPPLTYGYKSQPRTGGGNHFCGTTSLDGGTLAATVHDLIREFARHGARRIAVIDGHYENQMFLTEGIDLAIRDARAVGPAHVPLRTAGDSGGEPGPPWGRIRHGLALQAQRRRRAIHLRRRRHLQGRLA